MAETSGEGVLPPPLIGPVCWTCGQPGAHGSLDECLVSLRRTDEKIVTVDVPRARVVKASGPVVVRRYDRVHYHPIVFAASALTLAVRWIQYAKHKRGQRARHFYWIERPDTRAYKRR